MKVSVITVVYNNVDTVEECITSVFDQDYDNIEYIVIDGNSTDGTQSKIEKRRQKLSHYLSESDKGIYDAMNKGLKLASGEIIGFMNADDMFNSKDCISSIVETFKESKADIVYGDKVYFNQDLSKLKRYWKAGQLNLNNYKRGWMTPHLSTYIRRRVYEEFGSFRQDLSIAADYELMFRFIYCNQVTTTYLPKVIAKMREGGVSNGSVFKMLRTNYQVYKSWGINGQKMSPLIIILKPLSKIFQVINK